MATVAAALCRLLTILRCMLVDVYDVLLAQMGASEWGWAWQAEAGGQAEGAGEENKQQGEEQKV